MLFECVFDLWFEGFCKCCVVDDVACQSFFEEWLFLNAVLHKVCYCYHNIFIIFCYYNNIKLLNVCMLKECG